MTEPTEMTTVLEVIDATLAGDPVAPAHAELAELSLMLRAEREGPSPEFISRLDAAAARHFAAPPHRADDDRPREPWWRRHWLLAPGATVALAGVIAVVVVLGGGSPGPVNGRVAVPGSARSVNGGNAISSSSSSSSAAPSAGASGPSSGASGTSGASAGASGASAGASVPSTGASGAGVPTPFTHGRQVVQGASLALFARPSRVDSVAQAVFGVVAAQHGIVENSNIAASGSSGEASFQLSIPSARLGPALAALSDLPGARVLSRTDSSQDITRAVGGAGQRLGEDRALRRSLLRQLAAATDPTAVTKLRAQLHGVDAAIARDQTALDRLHRQVAFSAVAVTISSSTQQTQVDPFYVHPTAGGGFTLHRALHDAGVVLVFAAGAALILLAVSVPVAVLLIVLWWIAAVVRHRRREHALDLV